MDQENSNHFGGTHVFLSPFRKSNRLEKFGDGPRSDFLSDFQPTDSVCHKISRRNIHTEDQKFYYF